MHYSTPVWLVFTAVLISLTYESGWALPSSMHSLFTGRIIPFCRLLAAFFAEWVVYVGTCIAWIWYMVLTVFWLSAYSCFTGYLLALRTPFLRLCTRCLEILVRPSFYYTFAGLTAIVALRQMAFFLFERFQVVWLRCCQWWYYSSSLTSTGPKPVVAAPAALGSTSHEPIDYDFSVKPEMLLGETEFNVEKHPGGVGHFTTVTPLGDTKSISDAGMFGYCSMGKHRYVVFTEHQRKQFSLVRKAGGVIIMHGPSGQVVLGDNRGLAFRIGDISNYDVCATTISNTEASLMGLSAAAVGRMSGETGLALVYRRHEGKYRFSTAPVQRDATRGHGYLSHSCNTANHSSGSPIFLVAKSRLVIIGVHTAADNARRVNLGTSLEPVQIKSAVTRESTALHIANYPKEFYEEFLEDYLGRFMEMDEGRVFVPQQMFDDDEDTYDLEAYRGAIKPENTRNDGSLIEPFSVPDSGHLNLVSPGVVPGESRVSHSILLKKSRSELSIKDSGCPKLAHVELLKEKDEILEAKSRNTCESVSSLQIPSKPLPATPSKPKRRRQQKKLPATGLQIGDPQLKKLL